MGLTNKKLGTVCQRQRYIYQLSLWLCTKRKFCGIWFICYEITVCVPHVLVLLLSNSNMGLRGTVYIKMKKKLWIEELFLRHQNRHH